MVIKRKLRVGLLSSDRWMPLGVRCLGLKIALVGETNFLDLFAVLGKFFCGLGIQISPTWCSMGFGLTSSPTILEKCIWYITFYLQTEWTIFQPSLSWHLVRSSKGPGVTEAKVWGSPYFIHTYTNTAFPSPDSFPLHPLNAGILYLLTLGAHLPKLQPWRLILGCPWPSHVCLALKNSLNLSCAPVNALSPVLPADKRLFIFQHLEVRQHCSFLEEGVYILFSFVSMVSTSMIPSP